MRVALVDPPWTGVDPIDSGCREPHLTRLTHFSDIQEERPLPLRDLEAACG
jgi:hypothetical protein